VSGAGRLSRWLWVAAAGVYLFLHLPLAVLVAFSFNSSRFSADWTGFSLRWYRGLLERSDLLYALELSLVVGVVATAASVLLGTLLAVGLARHRLRGRRALEALLYLPIVTPEIVAGISLLVLFVLIRLPLGVTTVVLAHIAFCLPFVVVVMLARLEGMDRSLEEAALMLGADEISAFRRVTLPRLWPGMLAAGLLSFTISFDDFVITSFVAGPGSSTLPLVVYSMVRRTVEPTVNAISTVVLVLTTGLIYAADRLLREGAR
jgi:spermidine/putrescine transport system permease protein